MESKKAGLKSPKISGFGATNKPKNLYHQGVVYKTFKTLFEKVQEQKDNVRNLGLPNLDLT